MKVVRVDNGPIANRSDYETDLTDIREVAQKYGHTDDTMELYDDNGNLVAIASWPFGSKVYKYCTGKDLDPNPAWRVYRY